MTLDDDRMGWKAAEAIERGDDPQRPETAQFRLARLLAEHDDIHTVHHYMLVAGRVLAFLPRINAWFDAEQAKPKPPQQPGELRQFSATSDEDFFIEQAHYHRRGLEDAMAALSKMGSRYADDFDPDLREQDRQDDRDREARQDEAADAPRVAS